LRTGGERNRTHHHRTKLPKSPTEPGPRGSTWGVFHTCRGTGGIVMTLSRRFRKEHDLAASQRVQSRLVRSHHTQVIGVLRTRISSWSSGVRLSVAKIAHCLLSPSGRAHVMPSLPPVAERSNAAPVPPLSGSIRGIGLVSASSDARDGNTQCEQRPQSACEDACRKQSERGSRILRRGPDDRQGHQFPDGGSRRDGSGRQIRPGMYTETSSPFTRQPSG